MRSQLNLTMGDHVEKEVPGKYQKVTIFEGLREVKSSNEIKEFKDMHGGKSTRTARSAWQTQAEIGATSGRGLPWRSGWKSLP